MPRPMPISMNQFQHDASSLSLLFVFFVPLPSESGARGKGVRGRTTSDLMNRRQEISGRSYVRRIKIHRSASYFLSLHVHTHTYISSPFGNISFTLSVPSCQWTVIKRERSLQSSSSRPKTSIHPHLMIRSLLVLSFLLSLFSCPASPGRKGATAGQRGELRFRTNGPEDTVPKTTTLCLQRQHAHTHALMRTMDLRDHGIKKKQHSPLAYPSPFV